MEKFSLRVKSALSEILLYLSEKKVVFAFSLFAFFFYVFQIYQVYEVLPEFFCHFFDMTTLLHVCYSFALGCVFSIPATLLSERFSSSAFKKYAFQIAAGIAGSVLGYFARDGFWRGSGVYDSLYYFGIAFAVIAFSIFLFIPKTDSKAYFALVFKHFFFCSLLSLVVLAGMCLLIYAVQNLILDTSESFIYECCVAFCFLVVAVNSFAYHLFYKRNEASSGKAFRIIMLYILLPVFAVLLLILYAYLVKALVLLKLPNGQINWFVSFASCFYIVFYFILREYENLPAVRVFYRFGAFAFIPLICVQIPAFFIRVDAYGFTGYRYSSLLFIIFSVLAIALTFVKKGRFCKYSLPLLAALILFDSVSPFNLIDMAHKSQYGRMLGVLEKYSMFDMEKGTLTEYDREELEKTIGDDDRERLLGSYRYVVWKSGIPAPEWMRKIDEKESKNVGVLPFEELFGIKERKEDEKLLCFKSRVGNLKTTYDIAPFRRMKELHEYKSTYEYTDNEYTDKYPSVKIDTLNGTYDVTEFFLSLASKKDSGDATCPIWYSPDEKTTFLFENIDYEYNEERKLFRNFEYSGFAFYK